MCVTCNYLDKQSMYLRRVCFALNSRADPASRKRHDRARWCIKCIANVVTLLRITYLFSAFLLLMRFPSLSLYQSQDTYSILEILVSVFKYTEKEYLCESSFVECKTLISVEYKVIRI